MILESTIKKASEFLKYNKIPTYALDAQIILSNIMGVSKEFLILHSNIKINEKIQIEYNKAIKRRSNHEPVAYITG